MAVSKNPLIRYKILDKCFRNPYKRYFIDDLIYSCNEVLMEIDQDSKGISRRQILDDIAFMESSEGWSIDLIRHRDGKKVYYRYEDTAYSINNMPLNEVEINQLQSAMQILNQFTGMPQFGWVKEILPKLQQGISTTDSNNQVMSFDSNQYLKGIEHLSVFYNAITFKTALDITYQDFKSENPYHIILHPYYLKQYNNRWFLFGLNEKLGVISNYALDRVINVTEASINYKENDVINFDTYFDDCIGVTIPGKSKPQKLQIEISKELWPYIQTKPIHGSQKIKKIVDAITTIELNIIVNFELVSLLFSYGDQLKVLTPTNLSEQLKNKALSLVEKYS